MRRTFEDTLSMVAGAGIGALAMYLLDPQSGQRRRRQISAISREAVAVAGENITPIVSGIASHASALGHEVKERAREYGPRLADAGSRYLSDAGHEVTKRSRAAWDQGLSAWEHGRQLIGGRKPPERQISATSAGLGGAGLLAVGAGLVYLFDPNRGRARRNWLCDKSVALLRDAGGLARKTGEHLAHRAHGTYARAKSRIVSPEPPSDSELVARVRSELGHIVGDMTKVRVSSEEGYITLGGIIPADQLRDAESRVRRIPGVEGVHVETVSTIPQQPAGPNFAGGR